MNIIDGYKNGEKIDDIEVSVSYKIIELFSAGLYSSPNKAFEELICNSYDAMADIVSVYTSPDLNSNNAYIWVCDNGEGLNAKELKELWRIGESNKKQIIGSSNNRMQIGQFGIGKLSTYILARNLTYISKKNNKFLLATMDYNRIKEDTEKIVLDEIEISESDVKGLIERYTVVDGKNMVAFEMFGDNAPTSWTMSILTDLKAKASEIQIGRLKWILRTALPLNPQFNLYYNLEKIESSKINAPIMKTWIIGKDDITAQSLDAACTHDEENDTYVVDFLSLKGVNGSFVLYEDSLLGGKSEENGRSHGIFLSIRGRLINLDDPLLGMEPFSHGPFNRCRILINADGLNDNLTSTREAVKDSKPLNELKAYIKKKFNSEIRKYYFDQEELKENKKSIGYRMSQTAYTTSKKPIYKFIEKFYANEINNPLLIEKPLAENADALLPQYEGEDEEGKQVIEVIEWGILDSQSPVAKLNLQTKTLTINSLHPYIANYSDSYRNTLPLESFVVTEVLTEAHLYELGIDESDINSIMKKRDETLRQLALSDKEGIPAAAQLLHDSVSNPTGLENAVYRAFLALGFEATKIGGNGTPDGYAEAILGYTADGVSKNYSLTFDAKSTSGPRISAGTAKLSGLKRHQSDYKSTYSVEVAIGYEGEDDSESAISKEAVQQKVTVMKVQDLARLLLYAVPKQLGLSKLQNLFETCYTPAQVTTWVDSLVAETPEQGPYFDIIEVVYEFQKTDRESPTVEVVRMKVNERLKKTYSTQNIKAYMDALRNIVPGQFHFDGKYVSVDCAPDIIKKHITNAINSEIPSTMRDIYNAMFK
jgi:hypothetical protein